MPSIVDPSIEMGGAWKVTRGLLSVLRGKPLQARVEVIPLPFRSRANHRARQYAAFGRSLISPLPSKILFSRSAQMVSAVRRILHQRKFDLIVINGSDLLWLLPFLPLHQRVALVAHNIEHQLFADQITHGLAPAVLKPLLMRDCERLRDFELEGLQRVNNVIFLSSVDADYVGRQGLILNALTIPPLFDAAPHRIREVGKRTPGVIEAGMIANFSWWPNRQGLAWFLSAVMPRLNRNIRLHLFGADSERISDHPQMVKHGYVDDVSQIWSKCDFMICPSTCGGGVSVKTAEAISRRVPVVATPTAVRGLPLDADPAIIVLESADDWVLFLNSESAQELARRSIVGETASRFHPDAYADKIADFLRKFSSH